MSNDTGSTNRMNSVNHIAHDNPSRGYSARHSTFDSPFNMDFEYGYISMMTNFSSFVSRTQDMYSRMEEGFSDLLETQRERRIQSYMRRRQNNRDALVAAVDDEVDNNSNSLESRGSRGSRGSIRTRDAHIYINDDDDDDDNAGQTGETGEMGETPNTTNTTNNTNTTNTTNTTHNNRQRQPQRQANRGGLFDMGNILYSVVPRTVIIDPNSAGLRGLNGLSIHQVEENTEIINYDSIPSNEILNTECPISISPFTNTSVVLRLKRCGHCFVPFRMMAWLETHSTCPLCRLSVIEPVTGAATGTNASAENLAQTGDTDMNSDTITGPDMTNLFNSIRDNLVNSFNNMATATATATAPAATPTSTSSANNATQLLNQLSNLSIDNVNDDSIMFSFDMPPNSSAYGSQINDLNELSNSYIIPQLSQLFSNTLGRGASSRAPPNNNSNNNHDNNTNNDGDDHNMDLD